MQRRPPRKDILTNEETRGNEIKRSYIHKHHDDKTASRFARTEHPLVLTKWRCLNFRTVPPTTSESVIEEEGEEHGKCKKIVDGEDGGSIIEEEASERLRKYCTLYPHKKYTLKFKILTKNIDL